MAEATSRPGFWTRLGDARVRDVIRFRLSPVVRWQQVVGGSELPGDVRELIDRVVRRTRLWKREKLDVSRELISHFQEGIDAGASAVSLLSSFGDPQLAARLIRRAKRRGRPMWWQAWHWGWVSLAAVAALYLVAGLYQMTGRASIRVNYLAQINKAATTAPLDERAWPLYRKALEQMMSDGALPEWSWNSGMMPHDREWREATAWLEEHAAEMAAVREASKKPHLGLAVSMSPSAYGPDDRVLLFDEGELERYANTASDGQTSALSAAEDETLVDQWAGFDLPHTDRLRTLTALLLIDARRAALQQNGDVALADIQAALAVTEHMAQVPLLGQAKMANALQLGVYEAIEDVVFLQPELWLSAQLRELAHQVSAVEIDWHAALEGERLRFRDILQRIYTDNGHGDGRIALRGPRGLNIVDFFDEGSYEPRRTDEVTSDSLAMLALPAANLVIASRREMLDKLDEYAERSLKEIATPMWVSRPRWDYLPEITAKALGRLRYVYVWFFAWNLDAWRREIAATQGERDGALVGLAIELYRREHKVWPKSLDELSPRWLPAVPADPMTGVPLKYKVIDDRPRVYSVGADGDDDDAGQLAQAEGYEYAESLTPNFMDGDYNGDWVVWGGVRRPADVDADVLGEGAAPADDAADDAIEEPLDDPGEAPTDSGAENGEANSFDGI